MERRAFVAAGVAALTAASATAARTPPAGPPVLELRRYRLRSGVMASRFTSYVSAALIPALGRAGAAPVGAWTVALGAESPTLHLLLPHPDVASVTNLGERLAADAEYAKAAGELLALPSSDPPYRRCDSSLHAAVPAFPGTAVPGPGGSGTPRLFELRTYRSPSEPALLRKLAMFESLGELRIFARLGLEVVFFARDLVGPGLPSLTYMLAFADAAARESAWGRFGADPEWQALRSRPGYSDADIVCGIDSVLLRAAAGSQL